MRISFLFQTHWAESSFTDGKRVKTASFELFQVHQNMERMSYFHTGAQWLSPLEEPAANPDSSGT